MTPPARDGILNLNKPPGPTSHDCVYRVRRALLTKRVGHAGTLDPMATGVLLIGVGQGTRVLEYLQGLPKTYRAGVLFGIETDSQDTTGRTTREADASALTRERLLEALVGFRGEIMQVPPMVSALKVQGRRLYDLAREGQTVERQPRPVTIEAIDLLSFTPGPRARAEIRVRCSSGTYVRTLCHDVGQLLGTGAAMSSLEREAIGGFTVATAVPLDELTADVPLTPLAAALGHMPSVSVEEAGAVRLRQGQFIPVSPETPDGSLRVLAPDGALVAIGTARGHGEARLLSPEKVLAGGGS